MPRQQRRWLRDGSCRQSSEPGYSVEVEAVSAHGTRYRDRTGHGAGHWPRWTGSNISGPRRPPENVTAERKCSLFVRSGETAAAVCGPRCPEAVWMGAGVICHVSVSRVSVTCQRLTPRHASSQKTRPAPQLPLESLASRIGSMSSRWRWQRWRK